MSESRIWGVVPAAGAGRRMGAKRPKQYLPLAGATVLHHSLRILLSESRIAGVAVPLSPDDTRWRSEPMSNESRVHACEGGGERAESVLKALRHLCRAVQADRHDWVLVHDAVRPCLAAADLSRLIETVVDSGTGGVLGRPVADTLRHVDRENLSRGTVSRDGLWRAFTPQMFRLGDLQAAIESMLEGGQVPTDEAAAMENGGFSVRLVEGREDNLKITWPGDLERAETILSGARQ